MKKNSYKKGCVRSKMSSYDEAYILYIMMVHRTFPTFLAEQVFFR